RSRPLRTQFLGEGTLMIQAIKPASSADGVQWDLRDLYEGVDDPKINRNLEEAFRRAQAFESAYRGKINVEGGPSPDTLLTAVRELESLSELMDKPLIYASLVHAAKTDEPKHGALLARTREQRTLINKHLIFFDLEWVKLPDDAAQRLIRSPALAKFR